jgi:hypothetical protein
MTAPKSLTVRLPEDEHNALKLYAFLSETSLNEAVLDAIRFFLASKEEELFEQGIDRLRKQYRVALDKLADL